jgi:hypothetical protein
MGFIIDHLLPTMMIIATGWLITRLKLMDDTLWLGFERISYHVFFPALIIATLAKADLGMVDSVGVGGSVLAAVCIVGGGLLAARSILEQHLGIHGPAFTSVFQGAIRWNSFVAVALALSIYGPAGLAAMAVLFATLFPVLNIASIYVLSRYGTAGKPIRLWPMAKALAANPFIWSTAVGVALNVVSASLPSPVMSYVDLMGRAALAAGLLLVGGGLKLDMLRAANWGLALAIVLKLVMIPAIAVAIGLALGLRGSDLGVVIVATAVPTASASYILARAMGGDAPLMAGIVSAQTVLSILTLPVWLLLLT